MSAQLAHLPPPLDASGNTPDHFRRHARQIAQAVTGVMQGQLNCVGTLTLAPNTTSTVFTDARLSAQGSVSFEPLTASAAAELAAGTLFVPVTARGKGSYTVTHSSGAATDRTFRVIIIG